MLGRKSYTQEEVDAARSAVAEQLAAADGDDPAIFNGLLLALDRRFVHRLRSVTGKAGTPLNETELLVESLMNNGGVLRGNNVIKYSPEESVLRLEPGDPIALSKAQFEELAGACFQELEEKYVS
jgi:hypothetical protein